MHALLFFLLLPVAILLLGVVPDLHFQFPNFHPAHVVTSIVVTVVLSLALFRGIERWAEKITGCSVPFGRRILIPIPIFFWLATAVKAIVSPIGGYGSDWEINLYTNAAISAIVLLPFLVVEYRNLLLRFIVGVWIAHIVWILAAGSIVWSLHWVFADRSFTLE